MAKRVSLAMVLVALTVFGTALLAAPQATLTLRNGSRITCELVDLGGVGFTIRVSGIQQRIPADQVAVIDFTNGTIPASEASQVQDGRAFVVLHGGATFTGSLYDIGGDDPLRITFRTSFGDRDVSSSETARIYLARWDGMPSAGTGSGTGSGSGAGTTGLGRQGTGTSGSGRQGTGTSGSGRQGTGTSRSGRQGPGTSGSGRQGQSAQQGGTFVTIPASACWVGTGIRVWRGQFIAFYGSGEIQLSDDPNDVAGVAGSATGRYTQNGPMRRLLAGALLGRVEGGRPFGIGNQQQELAMPGDGELYLGINDDNCNDNRGQFTVQVMTNRQVGAARRFEACLARRARKPRAAARGGGPFRVSG